jgi:predicted phage terminase large subunit-like protein
MEALPGDPLGRKVGERLWPEWFTDDMVTVAKMDMRAWNALYQQQPASEDGDYFKREWLEQEYEELPANARKFGASDYGVTDSAGDYTEHGVFATDAAGNLYVDDWWRGQESADVWIDEKCTLVLRHQPNCWFGEAGPIRRAVEPFMRRRMIERGALCRVEWLPSVNDKPTRARSFQAMCSMRKVFFRKNLPHKADIIGQLLRFPAGKHDDSVDVCSLIGRGLQFIGQAGKGGHDFTKSAAAGARL